MAKGIVYIVRNPLFPTLIKIGYTTKNSVEARGLNASNIPEDFDVLKAYRCDNPKEIEAHLHDLFASHRHYTASGRETEFFYVGCLQGAKKSLELLERAGGLEIVTDEVASDIETQQGNDERYDEEKSIRPKSENMTFAKYGIPVGAKLVFRSDPDIQCEVVGPKNEVKYEGREYSISGLANKLYIDKGKNGNRNGFNCFKYNNKILYKRPSK